MTLPPQLPRCIDPLPNESLSGYLLRLAHRLGLTPSMTMQRTGLVARSGTTAANTLFALPAQVTEAFAHSTGLTPGQVTDLTLASLAPNYLPVDEQHRRRERPMHTALLKRNWLLTRSSRYCPECLAGDGSIIQQRHGGAWSKLWRLPIVFLCPTHHRFLQHTCPGCRHPAHRTPNALLIEQPGGPVAHPAACRSPTAWQHGRYNPCGHRLDDHSQLGRTSHHHLQQQLLLQTRLIRLLQSDGSTTTPSIGQPTTTVSYLTDLRIIANLITASWPAGQHLAIGRQARRIGTHARRRRKQIAMTRTAGRQTHPMAIFDKPPDDPAECSALLLAAANILDTTDPGSAQQTLQTLINSTARPTRKWITQVIVHSGHCSTGLQAVINHDSSTHDQRSTTRPPTAS